MNLPHAFQVLPSALCGNKFSLSIIESAHAIRVLRLKKHDVICLTDGVGNFYRALIERPDPKCITGKILKKFPNYGENNILIKLCMAMIKRDRFEFILEKATELGINEFIPLNLDRCTKKTINLERSKKIIISAAKQCNRSFFPSLHQPISLNQFFIHPKEQVIAGNIGSYLPLKSLDLNPDYPVYIIIGPEGDFSDAEINLMDQNDVLYFKMGNRRLRSETAALNSIAVLNELLG